MNITLLAQQLIKERKKREETDADVLQLSCIAAVPSPKILYPSQFACHACLACQSYALQEGVTSLGKAAKQQNDNVIASTKKRQKTILANNNKPRPRDSKLLGTF